MSDATDGRPRFLSLIFLLSAIWVASALTIASCGGGGGGDTNGELCQQCGESDGFCQGEMGIPPQDVFEGDDLPCDGDVPGGALEPRPCDLTLTCLRKTGDAQRRCFPVDFDPQFRCDGERPNLEIRSPSPTGSPTPMASLTPSATSVTPTPTPTATPVCGDGDIDGDEECDGTDPDDLCEDFCDGNEPAGAVLCNADCTFDFSGCPNPTACDPNGPPGG